MNCLYLWLSYNHHAVHIIGRTRIKFTPFSDLRSHRLLFGIWASTWNTKIAWILKGNGDGNRGGALDERIQYIIHLVGMHEVSPTNCHHCVCLGWGTAYQFWIVNELSIWCVGHIHLSMWSIGPGFVLCLSRCKRNHQYSSSKVMVVWDTCRQNLLWTCP